MVTKAEHIVIIEEEQRAQRLSSASAALERLVPLASSFNFYYRYE